MTQGEGGDAVIAVPLSCRPCAARILPLFPPAPYYPHDTRKTVSLAAEQVYANALDRCFEKVSLP
jgi:hypothetical protein